MDHWSGSGNQRFPRDFPKKNWEILLKNRHIYGICMAYMDGGFSPPLWKIWVSEFVSWDDCSIPNKCEFMNLIGLFSWLVGGWPTILKNMKVIRQWGWDYPIIPSWKIKFMFETTVTRLAYLWDILMGDSDILILIYGWLMALPILKKYESQWEGLYYTIYCGK